MAGLPMHEILGERGCARHPYCPMPCVECEGMSLSIGDQARGGFRGSVSKFDELEGDREQESPSDTSARAAVGATLNRWGLRKQIHAEGELA